jgi:hypothetical protein
LIHADTRMRPARPIGKGVGLAYELAGHLEIQSPTSGSSLRFTFLSTNPRLGSEEPSKFPTE